MASLLDRASQIGRLPLTRGRRWRPFRAAVGRGSIAGVARRRERVAADPALETARLTERARFACKIDVELRVACRMEAASRHELGTAARALLHNHGYRRLGFVRLSDYARERLGVSARTLQSAAWVATRLEALPLIATAFDRSELSWTQVRAVCALARADDQEEWLERARESTVEALERSAHASRQNGAAPADPDHDDGTIDGEPTIRLRIACPARVRALWRRAVELASRMAGEPLAAWRAAEVIAAEAFSGRPSGVSIVDRAVLACLRVARRTERSDTSTDVAAPHGTATANQSISPSRSATEPPRGAPAESSDSASDPFALDARLIEVMCVIRTSEPRIGRLLRIVVDHRLYRAHGFSSLADYVRERLGISVRKSWALLKVEKSTRRADAFSRAYDEGALSWVRALTLLPVIDRENAAAWVARADVVTVRRLADEVNWVLEVRDAGGAAATLGPPPLDSTLVSPVAQWFTRASSRESSRRPPVSRVQIGAHRPLENLLTKFDTHGRAAAEVCDVDIAFTAPVSVVTLFRQALDAFGEAGAPRWWALERVLQHVIQYWEDAPRHPDPIFARDGWRCTVPACSSRVNLHDHHVVYRSRGGGNERDNRIAVCASHHLHGIHRGAVRAWGTAPRDVYWQLGVRMGGPPLLSYVGDRRCSGEAEQTSIAFALAE